MSEHDYRVYCTWDPEARVWVATGDDVPGLATGADTLDVLVDKLKVVIPELLEANGLLSDHDTEDISFAVIAERREHASRATSMAENFTPAVKRLLRNAGCRFERQAKAITRSGSDHRSSVHG